MAFAWRKASILAPTGLADLEVLLDEVAALVKLRVVIGQLLELSVGPLEFGFCLHVVCFGSSLLSRLADDVVGVRIYGCIGVLHEVLIGLLRVFLGPDGLGLHCLRVVDNLLQHGQDTAAARIVLVGVEARRWGRTRRLLPGGLLEK